jgi:hypothetical protein
MPGAVAWSGVAVTLQSSAKPRCSSGSSATSAAKPSMLPPCSTIFFPFQSRRNQPRP